MVLNLSNANNLATKIECDLLSESTFEERSKEEQEMIVEGLVVDELNLKKDGFVVEDYFGAAMDLGRALEGFLGWSLSFLQDQKESLFVDFSIGSSPSTCTELDVEIFFIDGVN
ncbi:hypothetical protein L484_009020 [Morus notabilis]|uniref:Uncharacterized protein n=1 Tax=Morus notabilis TaxID=981085 RepID=W9RSU1_9ROSA|nr:hypothetical protein L484_009020 [Morus notabilis]